MTPERYLQTYRPSSYHRSINSLADFLQAVANGEDLWSEGTRAYIVYSTMNGAGDYQALKALGWSAGADYGSYGSEDMYIYKPQN
jgi:hypothetical protein